MRTDAGVTVRADPVSATLTATSPMTTIVSIGQDEGGYYDIYEARIAATGQFDKRSPVPTGRCQVGSHSCPNLRGVFRCVDVTNDIFSEYLSSRVKRSCIDKIDCGGCALSSDPGVDCTETFISGVQCVAGKCVAT